MTKRYVLMGVLLAIGCGGGGEATDAAVRPSSPLTGNWFATISTYCGLGFNLGADGSFSQTVACQDASKIDLQESQGTFTHDGSNLYVTISKSTCADTQPSFYYPYTVNSGALTVTTSTQLVLLSPNPSTGGNGLATFGCFSNGVFIPSPLAPI